VVKSLRTPKAPCKDCGDRNVGCHSVCEKYKEFAKENERVRNERYKHRQSMLNDYEYLVRRKKQMTRSGR
jgi:hypothetical protein